MANSKITVKATVQANKAKVWECYTQPEHIIHWNFATDDWKCPHASNDMRVGGKYSARMEAKDGSFGFDFEAVYTAIDPGNSFTFTMPDGRVVDLMFVDQDGATEVTTMFDPESMNPIEMQEAGWQMILNNFKKYTESV
jgi:uncharacterized protein YndB with AHSA1/START domain